MSSTIDSNTVGLLLVEDQELDARVVEAMLDGRFDLRRARSLAGAIDAVGARAPELVVLDLNLGDSAGLATLEELQDRAPGVPIVILSGDGDEDQAREAVALGAQDYLVKGSFDRRVLVRTLRYAVERARFVRERLDLEQNLASSRKLESVGQLASGIAHEINTPTQYVSDNTHFVRDALSDLLVLLERMRDAGAKGEALGAEELRGLLEDADAEYLAEELPRALDQSLQGLAHIARIVRAMKEFAHPASTEKSLTDVNAALETTSVVSTNEWKDVAKLETDFDSALPRIEALPGELNQVFLNLIVNAAHAIEDGRETGGGAVGRIVLRTRRDGGDRILVEVEDTGCGIPDDVCERIFDPFFTTKDVGRGTGQGLSIAHDVVVNKHGGSITAFARDEGGTCFRVTLPVSASDGARGDETAPEAAEGPRPADSERNDGSTAARAG